MLGTINVRMAAMRERKGCPIDRRAKSSVP
jgi:hypothetical protein